MSDIAISVENLSKQYRIGHREHAGTLRDALADRLAAPWRRRRPTNGSADSIWALRDVSFQIKQGEAVGIIGRNGAGKSTLLKILSRITEPTEGRAQIRGRIGSLLEVGTGFHPELTGRENIFLNGAILGMKKTEIVRRFDEIVAFAEVEKFIDTPIKRYSSGMYLRLAFAIAAHLEPDILLVDEVLAVGDAEFQKKCLGKMDATARVGRTVLFISHNLGSLANLCPRAILLAQGQVARDGPATNTIGDYLAMIKQSPGEQVWNDLRHAPGNDQVRLRAVRIACDGETTTEIDIQKDIHIEIEFWNLDPGANILTSIHLLDQMGQIVLASANMASANLIKDEWSSKPHPAGLFRTVCILPKDFLNEGRYTITVLLATDIAHIQLVEREVVSFTVHDTGAMRKEFGGAWLGLVRPRLAWQTKYLQSLNAQFDEERNR